MSWKLKHSKIALAVFETLFWRQWCDRFISKLGLVYSRAPQFLSNFFFNFSNSTSPYEFWCYRKLVKGNWICQFRVGDLLQIHLTTFLPCLFYLSYVCVSSSSVSIWAMNVWLISFWVWIKKSSLNRFIVSKSRFFFY